MRLGLVSSFSFLFLISLVNGNLPTVYEKIYTDVNGIVPCFRLTNATTQIGCSATPTNVSGTVWYADTQEVVNQLLNNQPNHSPYIVILETELFTSTNVMSMHNSKHINGIIIRYLQENTTFSHDIMNFSFSPAKSCPNSDFGSNECRDWNNGSSLSFRNLDTFAVFALTSNDSYNAVLKCYQDNNMNLNGGYGDYPLCAAQLKADMMSVGSTPECYQRAKIWTNLDVAPCDPLGDQNVWGTLFELEQEQNIIMLSTKLDSTAFFPYLAYGANNEMAGIVTLLAVAKALGDMKRDGSLVNTTNAIMFTFFQGESWDYIGSSRMVYDMAEKTFPYSYDSGKQQPPQFDMSKIKSFIELSQVGIQSYPDTDSPVYYLHSNNPALVSALKTGSSQYNITFQNSTTPVLPPASAQMFLRENQTVPVAIVTDYNEQYNNKFFGSRYDILENLIGADSVLDSSHSLVRQLTSLASAVAQTVLSLSDPTLTDNESPEVDPELIVQLLHCFLQRTDCDFFKGRLSYNVESILLSRPLYRYVSTNTVINTETYIAHQLLSNFTGEVLPYVTNCGDNCTTPDNVQTYSLLNQSNCVCTKSFTHMHTATSPAFINGNYSSDYYSTWAESRWGGIGMRIYLVTHVGLEVGLFFAGLILSVTAFLITCQCYRKGKEIFAVSANNIIAQSSSQVQ